MKDSFSKETLVMAGDLIKGLVKQYNVKLIPIDSEHNAILNDWGIKRFY